MKRSIAHEVITCESFEVAEIEGLNIAGNAARNDGPNAGQGPIIKQHAIEVLQHTRRFNNMINNKSTQIVALNERNSTLQK